MGAPQQSALLLVASVMLTACGDTATSTSRDDPGPGPTLDFAPVAGNWVGEVSAALVNRVITYDVVIELDAAAPQGHKIGTVAYGPGEDPADLVEVDCGGDLLALEVSNNHYAADEILTYGTDVCANGVVRLAHDPAAGTLAYEWYTVEGDLHATALLVRGE